MYVHSEATSAGAASDVVVDKATVPKVLAVILSRHRGLFCEARARVALYFGRRSAHRCSPSRRIQPPPGFILEQSPKSRARAFGNGIRVACDVLQSRRRLDALRCRVSGDGTFETAGDAP